MFDLCLNRIDYSITFRQPLLEIESPRHKTRASVREVWYVLSAGSTRLELATSGLTGKRPKIHTPVNAVILEDREAGILQNKKVR